GAGKWHKPDMKVVALYVDQKPDGDLSAARGKEFGFSVYPSIAEALRCGSSKIAVDAVLSIVEHGNYPRNEKGQVLYPRHEFFTQCMVERRKGGETGVKAVEMIEGDAVWRAGKEGRWSKDLLTAAISRSDTPQGLTIQDGRTQDLVNNGELPKLAKNPAAYFIEY